MGTIGPTVDLQDDGTIDNPIQERRCQGRVAKVIAPGREVDVGRQCSRTLPAAGIDDLEEEVRRLGRLLALDVIKAKFINDQQIKAGVIAYSFRQSLVGQRSGQVFQQTHW